MSYGCSKCEKYDKAGHNYCRICGRRLSKNGEHRPIVKKRYTSDEKFCGHCGRKRQECTCEPPAKPVKPG